MAYEKGSRPEGGFKRRGPARRRKKVCVVTVGAPATNKAVLANGLTENVFQT